MAKDLEKPDGLSFKEQLGILFHPLNLLKTFTSQVPIASGGVEVLNQIEGKRVDKRVTALEKTDAEMLTKLVQLESAAVKTSPPPFVEWPRAVSEFLQRNVEFAIVYSPTERPGQEFTLPVANGCLVGEDYVLTSSEALEFAIGGAQLKRGRVVILVGMVWYEFQAEPVDRASGLVLCKLTKRDEEKYKDAREIFKQEGLDTWEEPPTNSPVKWTISPWLGQEVGWIVPSDSEDTIRQSEISHVEFGTSVISHFKFPKNNALKVFVTAAYGGRIKQLGSAVFTRDGTLLGIISAVERFEYDAGRRAVVKTLLGFPKFTTPKLKTKNTEPIQSDKT